MTAEPTGREHLTPVAITSTSATERAGFRKCRRQWFLTTVHRLDRQEGNVNFFLGTIYHKGLEAYYRAQGEGLPDDDREVAALDAYQDAYDAYMAELKVQLGWLWDFGQKGFREVGELGYEMLQNYLERERLEPLLDEVIAVEFRVNVEIKDELGRVAGILSVQADVVGKKDGELCVVDHKTASQNLPSAHLDLDDQLTAEVYSWWLATGDFPEKAIYNVSLKKSPKPPKQLKKGGLSRAKNQNTTGSLYRAAIAELGLDKGEYVDVLVALDAADAAGGGLFRREAVFRTPGQMAAFERDLYQEWVDMKAVAAHPERAYPNPTSMNCQSCPVRVVCTTIQDGGDVEAVILGGFTIADPRR